jgi:hypothetical protein
MMHAANMERIRPWPDDPRYWQYKGRPVLLLGGSREDNLFQIPDLEPHLDLLASVGGNFVRNTMSDRDTGNVYPYAELPDGRYDLGRWNEEYWRRFEKLLRLSAERGVIVQIEVWDRFDLSRGNWERHPYNPARNVNYTSEETGLAGNYPDHPSADKQPFFHTVPGMPQYRKLYDLLRGYQERFVRRMLDASLPFGNVLYCMDNETTSDVRWGQHWMSLIRQRARGKAVDVYVTDMFDSAWRSEESEMLRIALDNPGLYDFIDVSQVNSRNFGEDHWRRLRWVVEQVARHPRPVNHTKIYSAGETGFGSGTPQDGLERFWRNLLGGSAACRFHRPTSGIGLNGTAQACIRAARIAESMVPFWKLKPRMDLFRDRAENSAYLATAPGRAYVAFLCRGGKVSLDLSEARTALSLDWIEIGTGCVRPHAPVDGGGIVRLAAPDEAPWVAVIRKT